MNREKAIVTAAAVLLIASAAVALEYLKKHQRLGEPGVKVVPVPLFDEHGKKAGEKTVHLPQDIAGYTSEAAPVERLVLDYLPADTVYGQRHYEAEDGFWIRSTAVLMGADRTSIHQPQYCVTGAGFQIVSEQSDVVRLADGLEVPVRKLHARGTFRGPNDSIVEQNRVLVYWFITKGSITADHDARMWQLAVEQLKTGVLQRWAYITCVAPCESGQEEAAFARVLEFIKQAAPEFLRP